MKARLAAMEAEAAKLREVGVLPPGMDPEIDLSRTCHLHDFNATTRTSACLLHYDDSLQIRNLVVLCITCRSGLATPPEHPVFERCDAERRCGEQRGTAVRGMTNAGAAARNSCWPRLC